MRFPTTRTAPSAKALALSLNGARLALGASLLAYPAPMIRQLGVDRASAARMSWLARTAAARDAALGAGGVVAVLRGRGQPGWVLAGVACDVVDAVVLVQAAQQRRVDPLRGRLMVGGAAVSAAAGIVSTVGLLRRRG